MKPLSLFDTPLQGVRLIEASAGTGKTYTITVLYMRLIVEQGLTVDQILVMTFTNAATAELRARIRSALVRLKRTYEQQFDDPISDALLRGKADVELRLQRIKLALLDFDRAAVFTIHGFCQRLLSDKAFESGLAFKSELLTDDQALLQEVVDDFWRDQIQDQVPGLIGYLLERRFTPDSLLSVLRGHINKPYLQIRGRLMPQGILQAEQVFNDSFTTARDCWQAERRDILDLLKQSDGLNRSKYRAASVDNWTLQLDQYLQASPGPWFDKFSKFTSTELSLSLKKGGAAPEHRFFELCEKLSDARRGLLDLYEQARVALLERLIAFSNQQLQQRKQELRLLAYDDLLLSLYRALESAGDDSLVASVRRVFQAALIDEFQDTDPLQYYIFRRLFRHAQASLFLVGDPKQAIYSFRGADIFAYLNAREDATQTYTLGENWRSQPGLIAAVNRLFDAAEQGFLFSQIPFLPAQPAQIDRMELHDPEQSAPVQIGWLDGNLNKEKATRAAAAWTAQEINRLINGVESGSPHLAGRPLAGGDIAVLVRTHRQGEVVQAALSAFGISSVQRAQEDVFHSDQALQLERLMRAVMAPQREGLLLVVLADGLVRMAGQELDCLQSEPVALADWLEQFQNYHDIWLRHGFMRMFRHFLRQQDVVLKLLGRVGGERELTNLLHLSELLHQQERETGAGMDALLGWLNRLRNSQGPQDEQRQLRLESDEQLVQIVTIHRSKGLQYPVVFCPFVWDSSVRKIGEGEVCSFHDPGQAYQAVLDLGSEQWSEARRRARTESLAESLRLLYVALTRAEHRCYLTWGRVNEAATSALFWLLHGEIGLLDEDLIETLELRFKSFTEEQMKSGLEHWRQGLEAEITIRSCADDSEQFQALASGAEQGGDVVRNLGRLQARPFTRRLNHGRRVTSFSALISGSSHFERPDHDGLVFGTTDSRAESVERTRFSFPRGAHSGSCLHAIFERLDFTLQDAAELEQLVAQQLSQFGIDQQWLPVVGRLVEDVLDTPLQETGLRLRGIEPGDCLVEMEFHYPLERLEVHRLVQILSDYGFQGRPGMERALEQLRFVDIEGYLKGFVDLIFCHEGRYYLVDYKSNWLGDQPDDYGQQALATTVAADGYYLQYLLYSVALHRYLAQRLADYDYERHFGAVFYLFLRGMEPAAGPACGVYRDRPEKALILALDRYFSEGGSVYA